MKQIMVNGYQMFKVSVKFTSSSSTLQKMTIMYGNEEVYVYYVNSYCGCG
jgi:hypothetical protein